MNNVNLLKIERGEQERIKSNYDLKNKSVHIFLENNPQPELSKEEMVCIDSYWEQFGIKFTDYSWFKFFKGVYGRFSPRFIPNDIYAYIIWPFYDKLTLCWGWMDKNYYDRFLPSLKWPDVVLHCSHRKFYDKDFNFVSKNDFETVSSLIKQAKVVIVKDTIDTGEGRGVKKYIVNTDDDVKRLLEDWQSENFIIQKCIHQNDAFAQFNESSVNIIRVSSWFHDGKTEILAPTLRIGTKGNVTDICYIDGIERINVLGITEEGYFMDDIINQDGIRTPVKSILKNPIRKVPKWNEIVFLIKQNHHLIGHYDIIGWDVTVTNKDEIVFVEYNIKRPGTVFYQYANGPFFGKQTDLVLEFLKDKENQNKYIPDWMKIK